MQTEGAWFVLMSESKEGHQAGRALRLRLGHLRLHISPDPVVTGLKFGPLADMRPPSCGDESIATMCRIGTATN